MSVFDDFRRTDMNFATYGEPTFSFLNRSNRPGFVAAREMIEDWFSRYPCPEQPQLAARFRDKNSAHSFHSAFFELFLHEFFTRGGCGIEVHPESNSSMKRPDFLITTPGGLRFYMEAVLVTGLSDDERASQARSDALYNGLNLVICPDYFILVHHDGFDPITPIPVSKVTKEVQRWIDGLDYEQIMALPRSDSFDSLPCLLVEHDGQTFKLVAIPKKREARGLPDVPPLGGHSGGGSWVRTHLDIRSAVKKKRASRYDLGGLPYVVAVRCQDAFTTTADVERALYGLRSGDVPHNLDELALADMEDGIWSGRRGATNTSLSAVMSVHDLHPWSVRSTMIYLFQNPWAKIRVDGDDVGVTEATLRTEGIQYFSRDHLHRFP